MKTCVRFRRSLFSMWEASYLRKARMFCFAHHESQVGSQRDDDLGSPFPIRNRVYLPYGTREKPIYRCTAPCIGPVSEVIDGRLVNMAQSERRISHSRSGQVAATFFSLWWVSQPTALSPDWLRLERRFSCKPVIDDVLNGRSQGPLPYFFTGMTTL